MTAAEARAGATDGGSAPPPPDGGQVDRDNPWPGLPSFREQDQEFFFGREAESEALRRIVMREATRATVLFGRSGLGKTSLLQAGLFPRLRRQEVLPVAIRLAYGGERSLVAQVREAILGASADAGVEAPAFPASETLWESFHRAGANFWNASNRIVVPLLVFDQFEEIFTLGKKDPGDREAFLAELADLVEGRPPAAVKARLDAEPALASGFSPARHDYKVLLSLRQDFLADLDGLRDRMRSLGSSRLALLHMNGESALRVVTRAGGHLIDADVAEKVVRFVSGAGRASGAGAKGAAGPVGPPGAGEAPPAEKGAAGRPVALKELEVDPTLLSLVCRELNNRRRERGQSKITFDLLSGSWKEILTQFYENSLAGLAPEVRTFVEDRLLTRSGYRDSVAWDNAVSTPGVSAADLLKLRDRRLLRFEERHGTDWIELTHDVLTEVIGESRELRRQREARRQAEAALREADERERQARASAHEAQERERETGRLLARSRKLAVVLGAVLLLAVALGAVAALLWRKSETAESAAESAQRRAERALFDSVGNLIEKGRTAQALAYLASTMRSNPRDGWPSRSRALDVLLHERWALPVFEVQHHRSVTAAELSPDEERLVTASTDGTARLWRVHDGASLGVMKHPDTVSWADFSPDGGRVLTAAMDDNGTARIWDGRNAAPIGRAMLHGSPVVEAAWSPAGDRLLTRSYRDVRLWDAGTQEQVPLPGAALVLFAAFPAFSPDGKQLLVPLTDGSSAFVDLSSGSRVGVLPPAGKPMVRTSFNHRGNRLLTVDAAGTVRVWDRMPPRVVSTYDHKLPVVWAEFSPDDHEILTVCADRAVRLWNVDVAGSHARVLQHDHELVIAHFSPDGLWVLTGSRDGSTRLWDARSGDLAAQPLLHAAPLDSVDFSHDGRWAVTAADDGTARVWDLRVGYSRPQQLPEHVRNASFVGEGLQVVAMLWDGTARLWDLLTGKSAGLPLGKRQVLSVTPLADGRLAALALDPNGHTFQVWDVTGKPMSAAIEDAPSGQLLVGAWVRVDGERVVLAGRDGVHIWDARTGRLIAGPTEKDGILGTSEDGRLLLGRRPAGVAVWETDTGQRVAEIEQKNVSRGRFGANGRFILIEGADHRLHLYDSASRKPVGDPLPLEGWLRGIDFSRDAKRLVATSQGGEVKAWDIDRGKVLCLLHVPALPDTQAGFNAAISADGRRMLSRSPEGWAQVWDLEACQPLSEPLWQPESRVYYARFSADGSRILTLDSKGSARVWEMPETSPADSAPLAELAEAVGGFAVDESGNAVPIADPVARLQRLRAASARAGGDPGLAWTVIRWFFADPVTRSLSPFSSVKLPGSEVAGSPR